MNEIRQGVFGAALRRRREELGLSLNDVAASTRIRKTYLQALEEENLQALPGTAYSIGFLRIYARQLGLPVEPLLAALNGVGIYPDVQPSVGADHSRTGRKSPRKIVGKRLAVLLVLLLLAGAALLYVRLSPQVEPPKSVAPDVSAVPPASPPVIVPSPPPQVSLPAAAPPAPETVAIELPVLPSGGAVVRMLPVAAGVLKVSLDNQELREYQLQPDQSLNWKVSETLAVELSAPGLVRVWVDQQELAVAEYPAYVLKSVPRQERQP